MKRSAKNEKKFNDVFILLFVGISCLCIGIFGYRIIDKKQDKINGARGTIFTNPALNYSELNQMISTNKVINLSKEVDEYASYKKSLGDLTYLAVYYRNLNNGGYFGVNEKEEFSPASLMKLPLLIAYVKKSEKLPNFLNQKVVYTKDVKDEDYIQNIEPGKNLQNGQKYTLREICEYMIKYSDNDAASFLEKHIPFIDVKETFEEMGVQFPKLKYGQFENNIRVIDYAAFFRILFNASYLNRSDSEKVLKLLSQVEFSDGINKGLPDNIKVSHKFGERGIIGANKKEEMQLHDCGIVYYPNHPYILCVMTRGFNNQKLKDSIREVSEIIYDEVESQYGENPLDISNNGVKK